ncbi:hypothetical protein CF327_g5615 [Tilletia walkeri]|uniref:Transcription initiation factor TFIID subunit 13 n=1 Tax=Tilletia walkeri TaxID=117179 RepID=A0A8X7T2X2_9BASI|nr:hypothetical protein CF327_g5615 [Tilletia walkeri]KAE8266173.1 hypothetical protein A4X09_0g6170 [Tilletia walkeri]
MAPSNAHAARYPRAQFTTNNANDPSSSSRDRDRTGGGGGYNAGSRGADRGTDEPETKRGRKAFNHRGMFAKDVRALLWAYGDAPEADPATVDLLEDLTVDFLTDLCHRSRPSPHSLPQGPGMRALVPLTDFSTGTTDLHPAAISALSSSSTPTLPPTASSSSQAYIPLPAHTAGHPFYTRARIKVDDVKHALRKDGKKFGRVEELMYLDKVIRDAKRQIDVGVGAVLASGAAAGGSGGGPS